MSGISQQGGLTLIGSTARVDRLSPLPTTSSTRLPASVGHSLSRDLSSDFCSSSTPPSRPLASVRARLNRLARALPMEPSPSVRGPRMNSMLYAHQSHNVVCNLTIQMSSGPSSGATTGESVRLVFLAIASSILRLTDRSSSRSSQPPALVRPRPSRPARALPTAPGLSARVPRRNSTL
jgi:hypothetical protein